MRVYSSSFGPVAMEAECYGIGIGIEIVRELKRPKVRMRGWVVRTYGTGRPKNSGRHGASNEASASWDQHGEWMARLYERDPDAVFVAANRYDSAEDFHAQTKDKYRQAVSITRAED